jgi:putative oxidoreductase
VTEPRRPLLPGWDLAFTRLVLAGIFLFAAYGKLQGVDDFARAIASFKIIADHRVIEWLAYITPWIEVVCGVALVLGFWARAAALVLFLMLLGFAAAMVSVIVRGLDVDCQCFGEYFGAGKVGWMSIARNVVFLAVAAPVMARGAGMLAIDTAFAKHRAPKPEGA